MVESLTADPVVKDSIPFVKQIVKAASTQLASDRRDRQTVPGRIVDGAICPNEY